MGCERLRYHLGASTGFGGRWRGRRLALALVGYASAIALRSALVAVVLAVFAANRKVILRQVQRL